MKEHPFLTCERICRELDVPFNANKGYSSTSALYEAGKRISHETRGGNRPIWLFYLGDHDPSGLDMTRDIEDRLGLFTYEYDKLHVVRLALNYDQVEAWGPPENPAKETDSRYPAYVGKFGESSWELDSVDPKTLASLVREAVTKLIDPGPWEETVEREDRMREDLRKYAEQYERRRKRGSRP